MPAEECFSVQAMTGKNPTNYVITSVRIDTAYLANTGNQHFVLHQITGVTFFVGLGDSRTVIRLYTFVYSE